VRVVGIVHPHTGPDFQNMLARSLDGDLVGISLPWRVRFVEAVVHVQKISVDIGVQHAIESHLQKLFLAVHAAHHNSRGFYPRVCLVRIPAYGFQPPLPPARCLSQSFSPRVSVPEFQSQSFSPRVSYSVDWSIFPAATRNLKTLDCHVLSNNSVLPPVRHTKPSGAIAPSLQSLWGIRLLCLGRRGRIAKINGQKALEK